jgi:hypothetical protein
LQGSAAGLSPNEVATPRCLKYQIGCPAGSAKLRRSELRVRFQISTRNFRPFHAGDDAFVLRQSRALPSSSAKDAGKTAVTGELWFVLGAHDR